MATTKSNTSTTKKTVKETSETKVETATEQDILIKNLFLLIKDIPHLNQHSETKISTCIIQLLTSLTG